MSTSTRPVMLIEDDPDIRAMVSQLLELEGYRVVASPNGVEALQALRVGSERPCLILLDLMMPVMNGWEFMAEQARDAGLAPIPVVVITGDARAAVRGSSPRIAGFLKKPIDLDVLLDTVKKHAA